MDERSVVFMEDKIRIIMYSSADKVDGQGVGSAYEEQVNLIKEGASDIFEAVSYTHLTLPTRSTV